MKGKKKKFNVCWNEYVQVEGERKKNKKQAKIKPFVTYQSIMCENKTKQTKKKSKQNQMNAHKRPLLLI